MRFLRYAEVQESLFFDLLNISVSLFPTVHSRKSCPKNKSNYGGLSDTCLRFWNVFDISKI